MRIKNHMDFWAGLMFVAFGLFLQASVPRARLALLQNVIGWHKARLQKVNVNGTICFAGFLGCAWQYHPRQHRPLWR